MLPKDGDDQYRLFADNEDAQSFKLESFSRQGDLPRPLNVVQQESQRILSEIPRHKDLSRTVFVPNLTQITSDMLSPFLRSEESLASCSEHVKEFYEKQNEHIETLCRVQRRLKKQQHLNHSFTASAKSETFSGDIALESNDHSIDGSLVSLSDTHSNSHHHQHQHHHQDHLPHQHLYVREKQDGHIHQVGEVVDHKVRKSVHFGDLDPPLKTDVLRQSSSLASVDLEKGYKADSEANASNSEAEEDEDDEDEDHSLRARVATGISLLCNVGLFTIKFLVAIASGSLSVLASTLDSLLDLVSGFVLWYTSRKAGLAAENIYAYPVGTSRAEPIGVLIFCAVMGMVSLQVIIEGVTRLADGEDDIEISFLDVILLLAVVGCKAALYLYCKVIQSPATQALAQDHRNDIITNSLGLIFAYLGATTEWWLDAAGAMAFSAYIVWTWFNTGKDMVDLFIGKAAEPNFIQQLACVAFNHHPKISKIDTVRAFHFGSELIVEVDIVLPENTLLKESHAIGETLQMKLEKMPSVERAFVHVDHDWDHAPEH
eukprot:TRINITY_DN4918_c0_g1_i1.p1 TRINITY_DN4918_c0_g1~~TRINITY_DN4918_c0_g1_i1.p1  ORF type:complete len:544 (-),score=129.68 TRINITY_DN4918_c0_g1_i1:407-2038(-)